MVRLQRRGKRSFISIVVAGLLAGAFALSAASSAGASGAPSSPRIAGGVEDGMFTRSCLSGQSSPNTSVLDAKTYRNRLGTVVRILVPWDIAAGSRPKQLGCLTRYLAAAKADGAQAEVSLNRTGAGQAGPTLHAYTTALDKLYKADGSAIRYLTAWNEPNNPGYLTEPAGTSAATLSGHYFDIAHAKFKTKVVAGDFASGVGPDFFTAYDAALGSIRPATWAIHPYTDVVAFQYYVHSGLSADNAGKKVDASSKILQFARELGAKGYGPSTRIWINEISIDHKATRNPPSGVAGQKNVTTFSQTNQAAAALFLSGGLGADSLPGVLVNTGLPQLTRYLYLPTVDFAQNLSDVDTLNTKAPSCLYYALAGKGSTKAPQCTG